MDSNKYQAPREWFAKFKDTMLSKGFQQSQHDPSLFLRHSSGVTLALVYADVILITSKDSDGIVLLQKSLLRPFKLKILVTLHIFLD